MTSLFKLRPAERAPTAIAFGFLALLVASHALLETARDALFLAHVSATRLPIMYLAIAASSLFLARLESRYLRKLSTRLSLVGWTAVSGLGTALVYVFLSEPSARHAGSLALYLLYVWSGLIAALVLVHFWSFLGAVLSVTQARRLSPLVGTGSVVGALIGSALAGAIANESLRDRTLLWRTLPAFASLEDESLSLLGEHVRLRRYRAGARLLAAFEPLHHVYIVIEGRVRCQRPGHERVTFAQRREGVGFLSLMAREPDGVDAVVEDDALVLELPAEILEHILALDFAIIRNMLRNCASALVDMRGQLPVAPEHAPPVGLGVRPERRRTMVERLIDMRDVPLFRRGNVEALIALTRRIEYVEVEAGHVFWQHGEVAPCWVVVEYGKVHCTNAAGVAIDVGASFVIGTMDDRATTARLHRARRNRGRGQSHRAGVVHGRARDALRSRSRIRGVHGAGRALGRCVNAGLCQLSVIEASALCTAVDGGVRVANMLRRCQSEPRLTDHREG